LIDDDQTVLVKYEEGMSDEDMDEKKKRHIELNENEEVERKTANTVTSQDNLALNHIFRSFCWKL
jgi:hypothetical protein